MNTDYFVRAEFELNTWEQPSYTAPSQFGISQFELIAVVLSLVALMVVLIYFMTRKKPTKTSAVAES